MNSRRRISAPKLRGSLSRLMTHLRAECMVGQEARAGPGGDRNGNFKHGVWTRESVDLHRAIRAKVREIRGLLRAISPGRP